MTKRPRPLHIHPEPAPLRRDLVTVIIPAYNSAPFLAESVESALAQTYPLREIIIVNDGSTDNTAEVMEPYLDRVIYIEQANAGPAAARNAGISQAQGEFLAFLDADDLWLPGKLERQVQLLKNRPELQLVYTRMMDFDHFSGQCASPFPEKVYSGHIFDKLLSECLILLSSVMVRTETIRNMGGFDEHLMTAEDTNLWLRICKSHPIAGIEEVLVRRRKHGNNISSNLNIPIGTLDNLDKIVSLHPETAPGVYPPMKAAYLKRGMGMLQDYFTGGKYDSCHAVGSRLLQIGCRKPAVYLYWLMTFVPKPVLDYTRRARLRMLHRPNGPGSGIKGASAGR